jgi:hypothetical protein
VPDELEDAAAKGRAQRAAADADKARYQERRDAAERRELELRCWASLSRWGIFRVAGMGPYYLFLFWLFALVPLNILILVWLRPSEQLFHILVPGHGRLYLPIIATVVGIAIWFIAGAMCRRAVARERAWLGSLPYRVTGYEERLGLYPSRGGKDLEFTLEFVDASPGASVVRDVLASDGGEWTFDSSSGLASRSSLQTFWARSTDHNRLEVRWFHKLTREQLRALHERFPIAALAFKPG